MYFLDTNICIYFLNDEVPRIREHIRNLPRHEICLPSVVLAELYYGAAKSRKRGYNLERYSRFAALYRVVAFDSTAARAYGDIRAQLEAKGQVIGGNDLMIAASAVAHGAVLVTNNVREFSRIHGLAVEDWTKR